MPMLAICLLGESFPLPPHPWNKSKMANVNVVSSGKGETSDHYKTWVWNTGRYDCSPSSSVASPLWIWTCSSCASEERWCWDTTQTNRERIIISDRAWIKCFVHQAFTHLIRLLFHGWVQGFSLQKFRADAGSGLQDVEYCGCATGKTGKEKEELDMSCGRVQQKQTVKSKTFYSNTLVYIYDLTVHFDCHLNMKKKLNWSQILLLRGAWWVNERSHTGWQTCSSGLFSLDGDSDSGTHRSCCCFTDMNNNFPQCFLTLEFGYCRLIVTLRCTHHSSHYCFSFYWEKSSQKQALMPCLLIMLLILFHYTFVLSIIKMVVDEGHKIKRWVTVGTGSISKGLTSKSFTN